MNTIKWDYESKPGSIERGAYEYIIKLRLKALSDGGTLKVIEEKFAGKSPLWTIMRKFPGEEEFVVDNYSEDEEETLRICRSIIKEAV